MKDKIKKFLDKSVDWLQLICISIFTVGIFSFGVDFGVWLYENEYTDLLDKFGFISDWTMIVAFTAWVIALPLIFIGTVVYWMYEEINKTCK